VCPHCGLEIPKGKFCKYCGKPLSPVESTSVTETRAAAVPSSEGVDTPEGMSRVSMGSDDAVAQLPNFGLTIEPFDSRSLAILMSRSELVIIDSELDHMIELIQATRQALKLKEADRALLNKRAEELRGSFEKLKSRREELRAVQGLLPLEQAVSDNDLYRSKLRKLDEAEGQLDKTVYEEQHELLVTRLKQIEKELKTSLKLTRQGLKALEAKKKQLKRELSRLDAKYKIGDMSESSYLQSKSQVGRTISILELAHGTLVEILKKAEKKQ